jgi:hypothetical protein
MANTRYNTVFKILPYGKQERYLPGYWWLGYKVSGNIYITASKYENNVLIR